MTKYERHIRELCRKYKIKILYKQSDFASNAYSKRIWINRRIKTVKPYTSSLHEIGHVINEHPRLKMDWKKRVWCYKRENDTVTEYVLQCEFRAWEIAKKLAKWWNDTADRNAVDCLIGYWYGYNQCHKKPFNGIHNRTLVKIHTAIYLDKELVSTMAEDLYG